MKLRYFFSLLVLTFISQSLLAQSGYEIKVKLDNYDQEQLMLGYHYGDKQYIKDSVTANTDGVFVFSGEEALDAGVYLVVMPPDNQYFQLLIDENEQQFSVKTDAKAPNANMQIEGSKDNQLFYDYMSYLGKKRPEADQLKKELEAASEGDKTVIQKKLDGLNEEVKAYQRNIVENESKTLTASLVKSGMESAPMPEFKGTEKEVQLQKYHYYKAHYFDNINLADERLVRSPILFPRIDYYMNKLTVQAPDSIIKSVDYILDKVKPAEATFKYYLVHFLNTYAQSKIVGMDAVYVHVAEKYYATGQAPWTDPEQLKKITDNAQTLKPILIGKTAPDLKMFEIDIEGTIDAEDDEDEYKRWRAKQPITLHGVDAPYTVLFVWDPDCGHCKKSMPKMIEFYDNYKDKGVEIFAVCTKTYEEMPACAKTMKEKGIVNWINAIDPFIRSNYKKIYDIRSTPQIFILDANKEIISKKIGA
ncbi:MAG: thioredoxin-like domain-containing protein, partial [Bacteroidota bacterium]